MEQAAPSTPPGIDPEVEAFVLRMLDEAEAITAAAPRERHFAVGGVTVALRTHGADYEERLSKALLHGSAEPAGAALRVFAVDAAIAGAELPPAWPFRFADRRHLERLHVTADRRVYACFNEDTFTWHVFDRSSGRAAVWTRNASVLPDWEYSFPMRTLFNWLFAPSATSLAHAAVVGDAGHGVLLAGAGGSGKSTTTAACLRAGLRTCGDDFVAVTGGDRPRAFALFDTIKLDERSLAWFPDLSGCVANAGATDEKARIHLGEALPAALMPACDLTALFVPRVAVGEKTAIEAISRGAALRALAPTTLFLVRGSETETVSKLSALVRRLPVYGLRIGGTPDQAAAAIVGFLEGGDS